MSWRCPELSIESCREPYPQRLAGSFILDGELVGESLHAFDALFIEGDDLRGLRYGERYFRLCELLRSL